MNKEQIIRILVKNADKLDNAGWGGKGWKEDYEDVAEEILELHEKELESLYIKFGQSIGSIISKE